MTIDPAERDERVMSLVAEALKTPLRERGSFLQVACQSDPDLYREVSEIVTWEERMGGFLSRPLVEFIDLEALEQIFEPGQIVEGRFEILRRVGDGGMGIVYEAFDHTLEQRIAIKCPKPGYDELLPRELKGALQVHHRNVCRVNEIHTTRADLEELRFLTMEFLDGETLAHRLEGGKLAEPDAWLIARQLCSGVAEAHSSEVLHRDLKPGNVILCRNKNGNTRAVITDFGLATETGNVGDLEGGTPNYMAPELWRGGKASQASDVFSLGVILYEMVTGSKPFPALTRQNVAFPTPVAPSKLVKNLPRLWDAAILPCLRENPNQRCSAEAVLAALERKPLYRRPAVLVAMAACLALAALAAPNIYTWLKPAPNNLVVLPVNAPGELTQRGDRILKDTAQRIRKIQPWKATVSVIPPAKAAAAGVTTPEQAAKTFGATHALQVELRPDGDGVSVKGYIIDLKDPKPAIGRDPDYTARFSKDNLDDLTTGLTGNVAFALNVSRTVNPETVNKTADPAYKHGLACIESRDFACAISLLKDAAQSDPHSPLPLAGLAEAYGRESDATEAQTWLQKAEVLDADSPSVRLASGLLYEFQKNYAMAHRDFERVKKIQPQNITAWLRSAVSYELQSRVDKATKEYTLAKAAEDYKQAIALEQDNYEPYTYLGSFYFNRGLYSKAEEPYYNAHKIKPELTGISASLAATYFAEGKEKEAGAVFDKLPPGQTTAAASNNRGAILAFHGNDVDAINEYKDAVQQDPSSLMYLQNLGDSQRRIKDLLHAKENYKKGLDLAKCDSNANRNSAFVLVYCAYFAAQLGKNRDSQQYVKAAIDSEGVDDQIILLAVQTYEALGDRKKAIDAAGQVSPETLNLMNRHPDLVDLRRDPEFIKLLQQKAAQ
jgi:tetratricopeptide (TPR) repeat protein